jgi:nitrogen fixation protein NifX
MLRIAFASSDRKTVNLHFGGAESLMLYDVAPGEAHLVGFAEFPKAEQVGETGRSGLTGTVHDKVLPKLGYVEGCAPSTPHRSGHRPSAASWRSASSPS